ncbi:MAG: hypothetical protein L6R42_005635 [Xanthoria sp. 1 TBL-2021]|nr:MAG: hypothetical protein L6R42_005635 [Xanthoria sp. 1 TBL-2021]
MAQGTSSTYPNYNNRPPPQLAPSQHHQVSNRKAQNSLLLLEYVLDIPCTTSQKKIHERYTHLCGLTNYKNYTVDRFLLEAKLA